MLSDSEVQCPDFFLNCFLLCRFKIFKILSEYSQTLASDNSKVFYRLSV